MPKNKKEMKQFEKAVKSFDKRHGFQNRQRNWGAELRLIDEEGKVVKEYQPVSCFDPQEVPYSENLVSFEFGEILTGPGGSMLMTTFSDGTLYYYGEIKENSQPAIDTLNKDIGEDVSSRVLFDTSDKYYIEHPLGNFILDHPIEDCLQLTSPESEIGKKPR